MSFVWPLRFGIYGKSQNFKNGVTEFRKCQLFDLDSFVRVKYLVLLLVVISGCQITPRYHQRGFQVSLRGSHTARPSAGNISTKSSNHLRHSNIQFSVSPCHDHCQDTAHRWGGDPGDMSINNSASSRLLARNQIHHAVNYAKNCDVKKYGTTETFSRRMYSQPPKKHSVFKQKDRDDRLELSAILSYAVGLLLALISWALASELIFAIGAVFLAAGLILCLVLGFNNITHSFAGYMSVFTILGTIYMLARFGFLDELLSALKI